MDALFPVALREVCSRMPLLLILTCLAGPVATVDAQVVDEADGSTPVKFRVVAHSTKWESIDVGDVTGHILAVGEFKGLAFFEGEVATASEVSIFDKTNGRGSAEGYVLFTFDDGATQVIAIQGEDVPTQEGGSVFDGSYSYTRGSGRFEGIKGSGTFTGQFYIDVQSGYSAFTGSYTLPGS